MTGPYHDLRVAQIIDETHDARSIVLEVPAPLRDTFAYRAGQFLTFRIEVGGQRLVRCYSLSSSPHTDEEHKVTVKRVDEGRVSNFLNDAVGEDTTLEVMKPAGVFTLNGRDAPIVLFGGGSGITPVISIVKSALASTARNLRLLYANRDRRSIIFDRELAELAQRYAGRFEVEHSLDAESGFVDAARVARFVGEARAADFYVCGPGPFMDVVEATVLGLGVDRAQLFIERFEYAADGAPKPAEPVVLEEGEVVPGSLRISLDGHTHDVPYHEGETIVEAARRAGIDPPTACEEGYCGCCMARLKGGTGRLKHNDVLDARQLAEGWVLTCQCVPTSAGVEVEYPD